MKKIKLTKNTLIMAILILLWLAVSVTVIYFTIAVSVSVSSRRLPVYRVEMSEKKAAITFNCAWDDSTTDEVLRILRENDVKCTFFFVGDYARKYPDDVRKIINEGHEPGNHSDKHTAPSKQTYAELLADISECNETVEALTGQKCKLYRAPSGEYTNDCISAAESLGMTTVQWNADSIDWKNKTPEEIVNRIKEKTVPGSIILFHLGKENTAEALPEIIKFLKDEGYELVTVSELLPDGDYEILHDGAARKKSPQSDEAASGGQTK